MLCHLLIVTAFVQTFSKRSSFSEMRGSVIAALLVVAVALAAPTPAGYTWRDCGSTRVRDLKVWITPDPQVLGKNWTIFYAYTPTSTFLNVSGMYTSTIDARLDGLPVHKDKLDICGTKNPIALADGYGRCPYAAGTRVTIHDTNAIPGFLPTHGYTTRVTYTSKATGAETWLCFDVNQTYVKA